MISSETIDQQVDNIKNNHFQGVNPNNSLRDDNLTMEAKEYSSMIIRSFKKSVMDRSISLYLGLDKFQNIKKPFCYLKANLMMECLQHFIHSQDGRGKSCPLIIQFESNRFYPLDDNRNVLSLLSPGNCLV